MIVRAGYEATLTEMAVSWDCLCLDCSGCRVGECVRFWVVMSVNLGRLELQVGFY